jgi:adenylate cyclase class IV
MNIEVEVKHHYDDHAGLERRLAYLGAVFQGTLRETNAFFDKPDASLRKSDQGLRLRIETLTPAPDPGPGQDAQQPPTTRINICHKGPRMHGPLKSRTETEVYVDDADKAGTLLELLGFQRTLSFEKIRRRWVLDGCRVELDTLPILGRFVEIEGPGEASVIATRKKIGLGDLPEERKSYITMLAEHVEKNAIKTRHVGFE